MAAGTQTREEEQDGWNIWTIGFMAMAAAVLFYFIPKEWKDGIVKWIGEILPAPALAMINKVFGMLGMEAPFPQADQQVSADIEKALKDQLGLDEATAQAIAKDKEHFMKVLQGAGVQPDQLTDMSKLKDLLGKPEVLKALLTDEKTAAHLVKMVPLGADVQRALLAAFKEKDAAGQHTFNYQALAEALKNAKPGEIKQTLIKGVLESMPEAGRSKMVDELMDKLGIKDKDARAFFKDNAVRVSDVYERLRDEKTGIGPQATDRAMGLFSAITGGGVINTEGLLKLLKDHGQRLSENIARIDPAKLVYPGTPAEQEKARSATVDGVGLLSKPANVSAILKYAQTLGLTDAELGSFITAFSEKPKEGETRDVIKALQRDPALYQKIRSNIPALGALLGKELDVSGMSALTQALIKAAGTEVGGAYPLLQNFLPEKKASAEPAVTPTKTLAEAGVEYDRGSEGQVPNPYEAARFAVAKVSNIQLG